MLWNPASFPKSHQTKNILNFDFKLMSYLNYSKSMEIDSTEDIKNSLVNETVLLPSKLHVKWIKLVFVPLILTHALEKLKL